MEHQLGHLNPVDAFTDRGVLTPKARIEMVALEADHEYPGGLILGEILTSGVFAPYDATLIAAGSAPVATQGDPGALLAGDYDVQYTYVDALGGESLPSPIDTVTIVANKEIHIAAITPLPDGAVWVNWYLSDAPNSFITRLVVQNTGLAFDLNVLPGGSNATPPLTSGAFQFTDGRQNARAIMKYPAITDDIGIWVGADMVLGRSEWGKAVDQIEVWWSGVFATAELTGLDDRAVSQLGRMISAGKLCVLGA